MSNYTPPDAHTVILDFKNEIQQIDTHKVILNFGADEIQVASIDAVINTMFLAELATEGFSLNTIDAEIQTRIVAEIQAIQGQLSQLSSTINTSFTAQISAVQIDEFCKLEAVINTAFTPNITTKFDINFNKGVFGALNTEYQSSRCILMNCVASSSSATLKALNNAFFYNNGLGLSSQVDFNFEKSNFLSREISKVYEQALMLATNSKFVWQDNLRIRTNTSFLFEKSEQLNAQAWLSWVELANKHRNYTYSYDLAKHIEKSYVFDWDCGLELLTSSNIKWDVAKSIHYKKHSIQPWPKPELPEYVGDTDLKFNCLCTCTSIDAHNVVLNFGVDDCIPAAVNQNWWYIVNEVSIFNTRTNEEINVLSGSYGTDRSRWCWSYSLIVTESEMSKIEKHDVLRISVNGSIHMMLYEYYSKSEKFADTKYTLIGRSQSAFLGMNETPTRSYLQENERTSVQLAQAELDWVGSNTQLNWQLTDELGWIVEAESLSYTNQKPIEAIKMIAEAGGGFVYSEKGGDQLTIKPLYKKTFWDLMQANDFDYLIPESLTVSHNESHIDFPNYNAITLTNSRNGNVGQVKRKDTAGDIQLNPVSNPLFDVTSMGGLARSQLAKAGRVEDHDFELPICEESPEQTPGNIFAFDGKWWGIVDGVDVDFTYSKVIQKIKVERTVNE